MRAKKNMQPMATMIARTAGICLAVSALGLVTPSPARAASFLDKLNSVLKSLPQPPQQTAPAALRRPGTRRRV